MRKAVSVLLAITPGTGSVDVLRLRTLVDAGAIPDGAVRPDDLASFALTPK